MSDLDCPFCGEPHRGYACDQCDELVCDDCLEYRETHPATRIDPADGIFVCPDCVGDAEASQEAAEERAAENRESMREWWP